MLTLVIQFMHHIFLFYFHFMDKQSLTNTEKIYIPVQFIIVKILYVSSLQSWKSVSTMSIFNRIYNWVNDKCFSSVMSKSFLAGFQDKVSHITAGLNILMLLQRVLSYWSPWLSSKADSVASMFHHDQ